MKKTPRWAYWAVPLLLLLVWFAVGATLGPYAGRLGEVATNDQAAFLPRSAESTRVVDARKPFEASASVPAVLVWTADGERVTGAQQEAATRSAGALAGRPGIAAAPSPAVLSEDGLAVQAVVPLAPDLGKELPAVLDEVRRAAGQVPGTTLQIAGPAAAQADLLDAFGGIDGLLLGVALGAVLLILLLVYRSVLLPLVIIFSAVLALGLACAVVYALADRGAVRVDGQVQGILSILVIGAATDYALLLAARFREELAARGDRAGAALAAVRRSAGAVTASAATVALGLIALLASDLTNNRALGPVGAIGIACAALCALTFLPAALAVLGRAAYWPATPKPADATGDAHAVWRRVAGLSGHRALPQVSRLDLETLQVRTYPLAADPLCPDCGPRGTDGPAPFTPVPRPKPAPGAQRLRAAGSYPMPYAALANPVTGVLGGGTWTDITSPTTAPVAGSVFMRGYAGLTDVTWSGQANRYTASRDLAFLEGLERYAGTHRRTGSRLLTASYAELGERALDPAECGFYAPRTYREDPLVSPFDPQRPIPWVYGHSLRDDRPVLVPARLVHYSAGLAADNFVFECSNGCAIGSCTEEALLGALLELIERDAFLLAWYGGLPLTEIDLASVPGRAVRTMADRAALQGYEVH
ncbi:TOMM precursor leader peptide-binding protein, partial [Streptomyces sp. NPDC001193]